MLCKSQRKNFPFSTKFSILKHTLCIGMFLGTWVPPSSSFFLTIFTVLFVVESLHYFSSSLFFFLCVYVTEHTIKVNLKHKQMSLNTKSVYCNTCVCAVWHVSWAMTHTHKWHLIILALMFCNNNDNKFNLQTSTLLWLLNR